MIDADTLSRRARALWEVVEPIAASVYFSPEAHAAYVQLGFDPSPGERGGVAVPDNVAYFTSRGACLGRAPGEVVAAAFGVFNPAVAVPAVAEGWTRTGPEIVLDARLRGATGQLRRLLGDRPDGMERATALLRRAAEASGGEGRHLFSGLRSLGYPGEPMGDFWRAADLVREHRGDSHIAAWISHDLDAVEIGLLTDLWAGRRFRSWVRTRGWTDDDLDDGAERLRSRGALDGDELTTAGRQLREDVERATDRMERRPVEALGDEIDELLAAVRPLARAVVEGHGYPATATRAAGAR